METINIFETKMWDAKIIFKEIYCASQNHDLKVYFVFKKILVGCQTDQAKCGISPLSLAKCSCLNMKESSSNII